MARIQVRRDTAVNWSTNNPTPLVGEPCFETDTGKLKIGDGTTAYNDLAYQGGGSTYELPVATATTLGGVKIKDNGGLFINSSNGLLAVSSTIPNATKFPQGIVCGGTSSFNTIKPVTVGTVGSSGYGTLQVKTGDYEGFIKMGYTSTGRGTFKGITTHTSTQILTTYGIYSAGAQSVDIFQIKGYVGVDIIPEVGTSSITASTLSIKPNSLTFTKSDGTKVDLLAGGGGSGDVSAAGNNTFTGLNTFNEPIQLKTSSNSVSIQQNSEQVGSTSEAVSYDCLTLQSSTGDICLNPIGNLDLENSSGEMVSREGRIVNGTNGEIIPSINDTDTSRQKTWSAKKLSTLTNAVQAADATAPTPENIYSFTVLASGTIYTAPFTGYIQSRLRFKSNSGYNDVELYLRNKENSASILLQRQTGSNAGIFEVFIPIKKGQMFGYNYTGNIDTDKPMNTLTLVKASGYENETIES